MREAIATERVYNIFRQLVAVKYYYEDGEVRTVQLHKKRVDTKRTKGRFKGRF